MIWRYSSFYFYSLICSSFLYDLYVFPHLYVFSPSSTIACEILCSHAMRGIDLHAFGVFFPESEADAWVQVLQEQSQLHAAASRNNSFSSNPGSDVGAFPVVLKDRFNVYLVPSHALTFFGECIMQITSRDIILYDASYSRQRIMSWPLTSLRRYGKDGKKFTFESGRWVRIIYMVSCMRQNRMTHGRLVAGIVRLVKDCSFSTPQRELRSMSKCEQQLEPLQRLLGCHGGSKWWVWHLRSSAVQIESRSILQLLFCRIITFCNLGECYPAPFLAAQMSHQLCSIPSVTLVTYQPTEVRTPCLWTPISHVLPWIPDYVHSTLPIAKGTSGNSWTTFASPTPSFRSEVMSVHLFNGLHWSLLGKWCQHLIFLQGNGMAYFDHGGAASPHPSTDSAFSSDMEADPNEVIYEERGLAPDFRKYLAVRKDRGSWTLIWHAKQFTCCMCLVCISFYLLSHSPFWQ